MRELGFAAFALAVLSTTPSSAGTVAHSCSDDRGADRCAEEGRRLQREMYGLQPLESYPTGSQVRRAYIIDGYGEDVVAVVFERVPGRDAVVRVIPHIFGDGGKPRHVEVTGSVSSITWERLVEAGENFHRKLVPEAEAAEGTIIVCIHGWLATVEAKDPRESDRVATDGACPDGGLALDYAFELSRLALEHLPQCSSLDAELYRNIPSLLRACGVLEGDRIAAAQAANAADRSGIDNPDAKSLSELQRAIEWDAALAWSGEPDITGRDAVAAAWREKFLENKELYVAIYRIRGDAADRVTIEGIVGYAVREGDVEAYREAAMTQEWRSDGYEFKLQNIVVEPFQAVPAR